MSQLVSTRILLAFSTHLGESFNHKLLVPNGKLDRVKSNLTRYCWVSLPSGYGGTVPLMEFELIMLHDVSNIFM